MVVAVVLVVYVLPKFRTFFATLNAKLPLPTRMLLAMPDWLGHWGVIAGGRHNRGSDRPLLGSRTERGREVKDTVVLKIPWSDRSYTLLSSSASAGSWHR